MAVEGSNTAKTEYYNNKMMLSGREKALVELIRSIGETPKNAPLVIAIKDGEPAYVEKPVYEIMRLD